MSERTPNYPELVPRLSNYRKAIKVTRKTVAEKTGIPVTLITKFENGTLCPCDGYQKTLAKFYDITVSDLIQPYNTPIWNSINSGALKLCDEFGTRSLKDYFEFMAIMQEQYGQKFSPIS